MKKSKTLMLMLLAGLAGPTQAADVLIRSVTVVSPELSAPIEATDVLIRDGRIHSLAASAAEIGPDAQQIDASGLFLTPGLMDSHVHTVMVPGFPMSAENNALDYLRLSRLYQRQQPRSYLYHGVTQLVDLAASPKLLAPFNKSAVRPHLLHCGAAPLENGYPTIFSRDKSLDALFPYHIVESTETGVSGPEAGDHTPERVVERMHNDGAACVKLFFEDGFGELSHWPLLGDDSVNRVIKAARDRGMKIVVHANALDMQGKALQFDIDVIAHGLWNWNQYRHEKVMPVSIQQHLDKLHNKGTQFQPTMGVMSGLRSLFDDNALQHPGFRNAVPKAMLDWYATPQGRWFKEELIAEEGWEGLSDAVLMSGFDAGMDRGGQVLGYLSKLGHPLLLASDTPSSPTYGNQPGFNTLLEILSMHRAGVSLTEVFRAATINNAVAFGIDADYGTVEKGKMANLLLLDISPLDSISAYDSIRQVIINGDVYDRSEFSAVNAGLEADD